MHLALCPHRRLERRTASICTDAVSLSLLLGFAERSAAMFFPVYIWVTLGNGFRFGLGYMYGAIAANAGCFIVMALLTPYWRDAWQFSAGLTLAIVAIPFYVAKLIRSLRDATSEAEAASRAKTEFLSMMSHELRTPLNAILGLAQLSRITATSTKERFSAVSTELAAGRLLRMVDTILNFQRIESGAAERRDRPFDMLDMLAEVKAIIDPLARQKGLAFHVRFASALPASMCSDPDHIQTITFNLVTNAVKYTRSGSVSLTVGLTHRTRHPELLIEVRDTGDGISPEAQSRIFDRFVRGDDHHALAEPGVGLGLSMCRSLAELLGRQPGMRKPAWRRVAFLGSLPVTVESAAGRETLPAPLAHAAPVFGFHRRRDDRPPTAPGAEELSPTLRKASRRFRRMSWSSTPPRRTRKRARPAGRADGKRTAARAHRAERHPRSRRRNCERRERDGDAVAAWRTGGDDRNDRALALARHPAIRRRTRWP